MEKSKESSLLKYFGEMEDPRIERRKLHKLSDILIIAICAVIGGADGFDAIEMFGEIHEKWFKTFLELPNGVPSHDTFARVFSRLNPQEFHTQFANWTKSLIDIFCEESDLKIIAIDGQTLRGAKRDGDVKSPIHIVSAWSTNLRMVLAQKKVDEKSNEITAIPEILKALDLKGCIVTLDAMGCQTEIGAKIIEQKGDYIFGLKGNQGTTLESVKEHFELNNKKVFNTFSEVDKGHGRIEERNYFVDDAKNVYDLKKWHGLKSVVKVTATRRIKNKITIENRYYLSSVSSEFSANIGKAIRNHWEIENSLHYVLDVTFSQDMSRIRKDNAAENFGVLRHIALNMLKTAPNAKKSSPSNNLKCQRAAADTVYLQNIIAKSGLLSHLI